MDIQNENYKEKIKIKLKEAQKKEERSFYGFFVRNYRITYLILLTIIALGVFSLFSLPREAEPEIKIPYAVVTTAYLGATPTDIEELVTDEIEEKIEELEDLKEYTSRSSEGVSSIFVEFEADADLKESFRKLKDAVDEARPYLPQEAESPVVTEINFNDFSIITYSLFGDYSDAELKKYANILQKKFEVIKGVSEAAIQGGTEREFQVLLNQEKLATFNISSSQIINAIQTSNFSLPAGNIDIDNFEYSIRVEGKFEDFSGLKDVVVATFEDSPIYLTDIAQIKDTFKEKTTESRIGLKDQSPKNTISLQIYKKTGGNILNIVEKTNKIVNTAHQEKLIPSNIEIIKTNDNSVYIKEDLQTLGMSGIETVILIALILFIILSFRGAIITALAVPIAFLMSFIFLYIQGMTLNSMVLFSLVLSLGLMVDNAIIVIEGINEYVEKHKKSIYEAAILSVWNFKWPIIAGTMTTVSAFLPMLLVSGIMGEYIAILPKTISITLLSSLFVALIVIPTLASRFIKINSENGHTGRSKKRHKFINNWLSKLQKKYAELLLSILLDKKKRKRIIAASWIIFLLAVATPIVGIMKIEMFPKVDFDYFNVNIKLPTGSTLEQTKIIAQQAEKIVAKTPEIDNYVTTLGSGSSQSRATIVVNLIEKELRNKKSYEIAQNLRSELENIQGAEVGLEEISGGPPTGAPIEVRIFGEDPKISSQLVKKISEFLEQKEGVVNIEDSMIDSPGEFTFSIDRQKANYYGLNIAQISSSLRNAIYGAKATTININDEDIDVVVKYDENQIKSVNDLENILLNTTKGERIPLSQISKVELKPALLSINHLNGKTITTLTADVEKGANVKKITDELNKEIKSGDIPENFSLTIGGETEDIQKSFTEMFLSMFLAIVLIAFILVLQFNSFKQPFIIIFTLPLAIIGVIIGLNIFRQPFSITAFIGIVSLSGIVVNDSIVLIDRINKNIQNGMDFVEGIVDGGLTRMQPIFITSLTTIAGIFPLIFANEMWVGLSLTVIAGLTFSTILTLIIIPIFYASMCRKDYEKIKINKS